MVRHFLLVNGWGETDDPKTADLAILFTCAFCESKVTDMVNEIVRLQAQMKSGAELMVGSCLPKTDKVRMEQVFKGRTLTPTDFTALDVLPGVTVKFEEMPPIYGKDAVCLSKEFSLVEPEKTAPLRDSVVKTFRSLKTHGSLETTKKIAVSLRRRFQAKGKIIFLSAGCLRKCSYCAIRFATGPLRSRPLHIIREEILDGLKSGCRRFELYADSIGDYGLDIGTDLGSVFDELLGLRNKRFSVGIYDLHPVTFIKYYDKILELCSAGKVHYLYVPLQSGSERILRLMKRPCKVLELREKLLKIKHFKKVFLQTSVIVGFPTETEEEFEETLAFLKAVDFDDGYIHCYTDMPGTESSKMSGKIDKETMFGRIKKIADAGIKHNVGETKHEWENIPL